MRNWRMRSAGFGVLACVMASGCGPGGYDVAPVSGVVTLYGEPLRDATVRFEPIGSSSIEGVVGPGSIGETDGEGRFTLKTHKGSRGAVVGMHKVKISTYKASFIDIANSDQVDVISPEYVPSRYNKKTVLTFDVPAGGTDQADFVLTRREQ